MKMNNFIARIDSILNKKLYIGNKLTELREEKSGQHIPFEAPDTIRYTVYSLDPNNHNDLKNFKPFPLRFWYSFFLASLFGMAEYVLLRDLIVTALKILYS